MNYTVLHDIVQYNTLPNDRFYIPCFEKLTNTLTKIIPDITFYFPHINIITKGHGYMRIYTNYNLHIVLYNYSPNSIEQTFEFFIGEHETSIYRITLGIDGHMSHHKLQKMLSQHHIKKEIIKSMHVDEMLMMSERQTRNMLKAYVDNETKELLKDKHEQDQIIENLDRKILQYKEEIRELKLT